MQGGAQQGFIARRRADLAAQRERGRLAALEEEQRQSRIQAEKETSRQAEAGKKCLFISTEGAL